jgi:thiamine biosynthesis lipoprotein
MIKKGIALLCIVLAIMITASCKREVKKAEDTLFALDTYITFKVIGGDQPRAGLDAAIERIKEIEQRMSATLPDSDISRINENAGVQPVKVHEDTFFVIQKALEYATKTGGAFDISMLPISRLWDITGENPRVPSQQEITERLSLVDYKKVKLNEADHTVYLEKKGMGIDLGGIAKGYTGDEVVRILKEHGVTNALINLGGNIVVINGKEDGSPWRIGIQNPRIEEDKEQRKHAAVVETKGNAVVTSGDYERYMTEIYQETGERYHHLFDPKTGYPAKNGVISVTILAENGIDADALTTSLFVLGLQDGLRLANSLQGVSAMMITEDKEIWFSENLKGKVSGIHPDFRTAN